MATKTANKQTRIPGTEPVEIPELTKAADAYASVRDERMALTEEEVDRRGALKDLLLKHGLTEYRYDGKVVTLIPGEAKVKVKRVDSEGDADDPEVE